MAGLANPPAAGEGARLARLRAPAARRGLRAGDGPPRAGGRVDRPRAPAPAGPLARRCLPRSPAEADPLRPTNEETREFAGLSWMPEEGLEPPTRGL